VCQRDLLAPDLEGRPGHLLAQLGNPFVHRHTKRVGLVREHALMSTRGDTTDPSDREDDEEEQQTSRRQTIAAHVRS